MRSLVELEAFLEQPLQADDPRKDAARLLEVAEAVLEHWVTARGEVPTGDQREGFRLLALHRQGTRGDPSFNACRETCREVAYHYNLVTIEPAPVDITDRLQMLQMIVKHLLLFVSGKMQVAELGEFCCSSRPIRNAEAATTV